MPIAESSPLVVREYRSGHALCMCGCGDVAPVTTRSRRERGFLRGQPQSYICGHAGARRREWWTVVDLGFDSPCWIWNGSKGVEGYCLCVRDGVAYPAHRWVYEQRVAAIPAGLQLDHLCQNRACVNPAHLEPVTPRENTLRGRNARLDRGARVAVLLLLASTSLNKTEIGEIYGVSRELIRKVECAGWNGALRP